MVFSTSRPHYKVAANECIYRACVHVGMDFRSANAFYLESGHLRTTNMLKLAGMTSNQLHVANSDTREADAIRQEVPNTMHCTSTEYLKETLQQFNLLWLDYCQSVKNFFDDPRLIFEHNIMLPGIIAVTTSRRCSTFGQDLDYWIDTLFACADAAGYDLCELLCEDYAPTMKLIIWQVKPSMQIDLHEEAMRVIGSPVVFQEDDCVVFDGVKYYEQRPQSTVPKPDRILDVLHKDIWYAFGCAGKDYWCKGTVDKLAKSGAAKTEYGGPKLDSIVLKLEKYDQLWFLA